MKEAHRWAAINETLLRTQLRYVYTHRRAAAQIGQRARKHIIRHYSRDPVADLVLQRLALAQQAIIARERSTASIKAGKGVSTNTTTTSLS